MSRVAISRYGHENKPDDGTGGAVIVRKIRRIFSGLSKRYGIARYQRFVPPDEASRDLFTGGRPPAPGLVIARGFDLPNEPPPPGDGQHILFLGRIDVEEKGLDLLLAAVAEAMPGLPVVLAGAGSRAEERKLVDLLGQTCGPVAWVGHVCCPARDALLRDCAFAVLPSRRVTAGRSAVEAMTWGKPVVHFDLPALRWMGDEAAIGVPAFDVGALSTAIRGLTSDDGRRASMGRAARQTAERYARTVSPNVTRISQTGD